MAVQHITEALETKTLRSRLQKLKFDAARKFPVSCFFMRLVESRRSPSNHVHCLSLSLTLCLSVAHLSAAVAGITMRHISSSLQKQIFLSSQTNISVQRTSISICVHLRMRMSACMCVCVRLISYACEEQF